MKKKGLIAKDIKGKSKTIEYKVKDFKPIKFKEGKELYPDLTKEQYKNKYFSFPECYRFLEVLYYWVNENPDAIFFQDFYYQAYPKAVKDKKIKPFSFTVNKDTLVNIRLRLPYLDSYINVIKDIQDFKIFKKGLTGEWYAGLVTTYLRTHSKSEWTETIKQEIVNKTQILNIDPLETNEE